MTEAVAARSNPDWRRWRCDLTDEEPGPGSVELRCSNGRGALLMAARAQARLDGHPGVVSVHRADLTAGSRCEVRLGWAGTTLARVLGRRRGPDGSPQARLPVADLLSIGATVAATLDDAHRLHPALVHGSLDATAIRLDGWGRARLDGFGARFPTQHPGDPGEDVHGLLATLGHALGLGSLDGLPADPAPALISSLLASVRQRRPDVIDAGELGRALDAMADRCATGAGRTDPATGRSGRLVSQPRAGGHRRAAGSAALVRCDADATVTLDERVQPLTPGPLPPGSRPPRALPHGLLALRRLGQGGHGDVWLAHDPLLKRDVVVKEFSLGPSPATRLPAPMVRELTALKQLAGHPASVECYGSAAGRRPSLVLSWCSEGALDGDRRWSPTELAQLGAQVADALAVLHGRGLVHGDIKPHNLLRDRWGAVRLADFSLTSPSGAPSPPECSPRHAPPEQLDGGPLSPGADLAALAATLFHLAEGHPPFDRNDGNEALVARRRAGALETPPASLDELPGLSDWVMAWLEPQPDRRPSGGATVAAATLRALYRPQASDASLPTPPSQPHRKGRRPTPGRATMLAAALVAVLSVAALALAIRGPTTSPVDGGPTSGAGRARPAADADAGSGAVGVAAALDPPDPLGAGSSAGLTIRRRTDGTAVLLRAADADPDVPWVLRRDDYPTHRGIVDDRPSASGPAGSDGAIGGSGPMLRSGTQHASILADFAGTSCVRVVTARRPPEVSAPLCWG